MSPRATSMEEYSPDGDAREHAGRDVDREDAHVVEAQPRGVGAVDGDVLAAAHALNLLRLDALDALDGVDVDAELLRVAALEEQERAALGGGGVLARGVGLRQLGVSHRERDGVAVSHEALPPRGSHSRSPAALPPQRGTSAASPASRPLRKGHRVALAADRAREARAAWSSAKSTGLVRCASNPASMERRRSSTRP